MIIEITWIEVAIVVGALAALFVIIVCAFVISRKCRRRKDVKGKVALVTGGGNGLGQQICIQLAQHGCNVAIADIDLEAAIKTAEMLTKLSVLARAYKVDVSSYTEIVQLKQNILSDLGEVDILVNNAGLVPYKTIFDQSAEELERLTRVNFNSVMLMTKCFLENMVKRRTGHIATVASLQGIYANPYSLSYCATKFGAYGFMLGLKEFIRRNNLQKEIFACCIMPDVIATRADIIAAVNSNYSILKAEDVAKTAVDGILFNETIVSVPSFYAFGIKIFNVLPFCAQHFIRDHLRKEKDFLANPYSPNNSIV